MSLFFRILLCIAMIGIFLFGYIEKQNHLTELRLEIPLLAKEVKSIQEENIRLQYELDQWESPVHLLELSRRPEFGHLKHPLEKDILQLNEQKHVER